MPTVEPTAPSLPEPVKALLSQLEPFEKKIDVPLVEKAIEFARVHHGEQQRASGEPYYLHPVAVSEIVAQFGLDTSSIVTAILHDTVEDTDVTVDDLEREFGKEIAVLVDGVTKLTRLEYQTEVAHQAENYRKLLMAISEDIRVLVVKLADRLHNMRTLHHIGKKEKRARIAQETLEIYAPLAERIGMHKIKDELQDISFKELSPEGYESIVSRLNFLRESGKPMVDSIIGHITNTLDQGGLQEFQIYGREKRPYSIWRKMEKYNVGFEQLSDIIAFRVIVKSAQDCYLALGLIHAAYHMVPGTFKDYISTPKDNGYQSLHTIVMGPEQQRIEIQIRTHEMHEIAEMGLAAHWSYKQGRDYNTDGKQYRWIRELLYIIQNASEPEEFIENTKLEMYHDQVFCFTPKGRIVALPQSATPVDFAYAIHSDLGNQCVGAKVNGRIVPLRTKLNNGDQVEIITSKTQTPSPTWESFAVTGKAKSAIRRFIRTRQRQEYVVLGKSILAKAFETEQLPFEEKIIEDALPKMQKKSLEDLYALLGEGAISKQEIILAVFPDYKPQSKTQRFSLLQRLRGTKQVENITYGKSVPIRGLIPGMAVQFAGCCHPLPGDRIVGIVHTGKGITIHTTDCNELEQFTSEPERWINVSWDGEAAADTYVGRLKAVLSHESGSLGTLANCIAKENGNINNLKIINRSSDFFEIIVDVEVNDIKHLANIMATLRSKSAIYSVERFH